MKTLIFLLTALALLPAPACLAIERAEVETLAKILALTKDIPSGEVAMAAVYNPDSPRSVSDLRHLTELLQRPVNGPHHTLRIVPTTPGETAGIGNRRVVLVLDGLSNAQLEQIDQNIGKRRVLVATSNLHYVEEGHAMLGVSVGNVVKVLVNRAELDSSGLTFDPVFQFMVNEI